MTNTTTLIKEEFWTLVCEEHGFTCDFKTKKQALAWKDDSSVWCEKC